MKYTAVEWLVEQYYDSEGKLGRQDFEQAKEMEKQQIIDAAERWKGTDFAEKYYAETYGSKGSEEDLIDAINMARNEPDMSGDDIILSIKQSKPTSSQTESRKIM